MTAVGAAQPGIDLRWHLRAAGRTLLYLLLALPYGLGYLILAPPASVLRRRVFWRLAEVERRQANRRLDAHLPPVPFVHDRGGFLRALALLVLKLPVTLAAIALVALPLLLVIALLALGVEGLGGDADRVVGAWTLGPAVGIALCLLAVPAAIVSIAVIDGVGALLRRLTKALLRTDTAGAGPVREMLAERLGDRSLNIAYWLPDREIFVDERGHPVLLPGAGSGRAWTAVERDGRRVAAIVHDAELATGPELVNAAAAGAALAIDNERLKADLRARVEELRVSRVRIVEAADSARRRIERDLHDGAQQQLVSLSLDLRLLKSKLNGNEAAAATVDALSEKLATALAELRELARGIHPVILTERGLVPAVAALAQRAPVPVEANISIHDRLTPAIESAAYFVVAEALTNVAKYAQAENVIVDLRRRHDEVTVLVEDDGVGGADIETGTGLRGLIDRLSALDGTLEVEIPEGGGTRLIAGIPCTAGDLVPEATPDEAAQPTSTEAGR